MSVLSLFHRWHVPLCRLLDKVRKGHGRHLAARVRCVAIRDHIVAQVEELQDSPRVACGLVSRGGEDTQRPA